MYYLAFIILYSNFFNPNMSVLLSKHKWKYSGKWKENIAVYITWGLLIGLWYLVWCHGIKFW